MTDQVATPPSPKGTRRFALAALAVAVAALLAITVGGIGGEPRVLLGAG